MDPLASSRTAGSRTGRCLLVAFFALVLFRHSIVAVAVASDSGHLQGVDGVSKDSLARLRIRGEPVRPNDVPDRIGSEGTSLQADVSPPAICIRRVEGWRSILGDVSPPVMWPTPNVQDDVPPVVAEDSSEQTEHRDQHLRTISGRIVVLEADRTCQDTVQIEMESISLQPKLREEEPRFRSRSLLQGDISPPGMWPDSDDDESQLSESVLLRGRRLMSM